MDLREAIPLIMLGSAVIVIAALFADTPDEPQYIEDVIYTIEHDGHEFVVVHDTVGVAMIHHPDCPCQTSR